MYLFNDLANSWLILGPGIHCNQMNTNKHKYSLIPELLVHVLTVFDCVVSSMFVLASVWAHWLSSYFQIGCLLMIMEP